MKRLSIIVWFSFISIHFYAQELNCNVNVNTSKISGSNKDIFETLQESIFDFMNNTVWTNHVYEAHERIECNILITLDDPQNSSMYAGSIQIQSRRPVYGSSYSTTILNYVDNDLEFEYEEGDPLVLSDNDFTSNISSLLTFYAYIIIGLDYDTFSPLGGTVFLEKAEKVVTNAQTSGATGWMSGDDRERRNRYWLIENLLDENYRPVRQFYYDYHRKGLDVLQATVGQGTEAIKQSLLELETFKKNPADPFMSLLRIIFDSKSEEFVSVFSNSPQDEKIAMQKLLTGIDPANSRKYDKLRE